MFQASLAPPPRTRCPHRTASAQCTAAVHCTAAAHRTAAVAFTELLPYIDCLPELRTHVAMQCTLYCSYCPSLYCSSLCCLYCPLPCAVLLHENVTSTRCRAMAPQAALLARQGRRPSSIPQDHPACLSSLCVTATGPAHQEPPGHGSSHPGHTSLHWLPAHVGGH